MPRPSLSTFRDAKPRDSALVRVRCSVCTLTALSCLLFSKLPEAHAQSAAPARNERGTVPVTLAGSRRGLALSIRSEVDARYAWQCQDGCQLRLFPGRYRVGVVENGERSWRRVTIREPVWLTLTPPDRAARNVGSGLTIAGMIVGGLGSAAFVYGVGRALPCAYAEEPGGHCPEYPKTLILAGLGGMAAGIALAIPGIVLVLKNGGPRVEVERYGALGNRRTLALSLRWLGSDAPLGFRVGAEF